MLFHQLFKNSPFLPFQEIAENLGFLQGLGANLKNNFFNCKFAPNL